MAIPALGPVGPGTIGGLPDVGGAPRVPGGGQDFGQMIQNGLENVSKAEAAVDQVAQNIASGGTAEIHDLMAAGAKAQIQVDLLVQVRNRAVEAYQEIMRIQV